MQDMKYLGSELVSLLCQTKLVIFLLLKRKLVYLNLDMYIWMLVYGFSQLWVRKLYPFQRNLDQLEALSKKLKAKTIRTETPSQSIAATRYL